MRSKSQTAGLAILFLIITANLCFAAVPDSGLIMQGTPHETAYFVFDSGKPGHTVMVVGGVHGNEPSGHEAAKWLYEDFLHDRRTLQAGKLVIIPAANVTGLKEKKRKLEGVDLNRQYPGVKNGNPAQQIAYQIDQLMRQHRVQMVIDLHSGFRNASGKGMGNTVRGTIGAGRLLAKETADYINQQMGYQATEHKYWRQGGIPKPNTTAGNINQPAHGDKPGFTIETLRYDSPLPVKVREHLYAVEYLLASMGLLEKGH